MNSFSLSVLKTIVCMPCGEMLNFNVAYLIRNTFSGKCPDPGKLCLQCRFEIGSFKHFKLFNLSVRIGQRNNS